MRWNRKHFNIESLKTYFGGEKSSQISSDLDHRLNKSAYLKLFLNRFLSFSSDFNKIHWREEMMIWDLSWNFLAPKMKLENAKKWNQHIKASKFYVHVFFTLIHLLLLSSIAKKYIFRSWLNYHMRNAIEIVNLENNILSSVHKNYSNYFILFYHLT